MKHRKLFLILLVIVSLFLFTSCKSQEEKALEEAQIAAEEAEENLRIAEENYAETTRLLEEYEYLQQLISTLPDGSIEQQNAIERNNEIVRQLMEEYPELSQYVTGY